MWIENNAEDDEDEEDESTYEQWVFVYCLDLLNDEKWYQIRNSLLECIEIGIVHLML